MAVEYPAGYYNRWDRETGYTELVFLAGKGYQSAEPNEMQAIQAARTADLGNAIFKDGDRIRDANIILSDGPGGSILVTAEPGLIWIAGAVRAVPAGSFQMPPTGTWDVGVRRVSEIVTATEDAALTDPATGTRNYGEPGAARIRETYSWGFTFDSEGYEFYPVYRVQDGVLINPEPPPQFDGVNQALARYDRDANGSYMVSGLNVVCLQSTTAGQVFSISEGVANVNGYKVTRPSGTRFTRAFDPDLSLISNEPSIFTGPSTQRVNTNRSPIHEVAAVEVTKEKTVSIIRGVTTGGLDVLPDEAVLSIQSVVQGGTTYVQNTDYKLTAGSVDWSLAGAEPATGSTYSVTYRYITTVAPTGLDDTGFTISGAVVGTQVQTTYRWRLPRWDRIVIDQDGNLQWIKGLSHPFQPRKPDAPTGTLNIASINQRWSSTVRPDVLADGVKTVLVADLQAMQKQVSDLYLLVADSRLRDNVNALAPVTKYGVFTDPFFDDDLRDAGVSQTAAIVPGLLRLPIAPTVTSLAALPGGKPALLPYTLSAVVSQPLATGGMKVNPYQAFDPLPLAVSLSPSTDFWTVVEENVVSRVTETLDTARGTIQGTRSTTSVQIVASTTRPIPFLRQTAVTVTASGFGSGENLATATFDGINVKPAGTQTANGSGVLTFSFNVPAGIPQGARTLAITGAGGTQGSAVFVGSGETLTRTVLETTTTQVIRTTTNPAAGVARTDPLAQTFTLSEARHIGGVDLYFAVKGGNKPVIVQIRPTELGFPTGDVVAEAIIPSTGIVTNAAVRVEFMAPVYLPAGREYAIVLLTDDANHQARIAQLGQFDETAQQWVAAQPYQIGVLLSSSNASTWTAHQDRDLTFALLACDFTATSRTISLGSVAAVSMSDLLIRAGVERTAPGIDLQFVIKQGSNVIATVQEDQPINLTSRYSATLTVDAVMTGDAKNSPVLWTGSQFVAGNLGTSGTYVSRSFPCDTATRLKVVVDALLPSGSSLTVEARNASNAWVSLTQVGSAVPLGDGYVEITYQRDPINLGGATVTALRLTITGTEAARPAVGNLRAFAI